MRDELLNKYKEVFSEKGDFKYYSPNTLYNLIYHLKSLEEGNKKIQIENKLTQYLELISNNPISNIEDCQAIYQTYLQPITLYYNKKAGFISYGKPQMLIPIFLFPSFIIVYFFNYFTTWVIVVFFLLSAFGYNFQKYKAKKTYGLAW